MAVQMNLTDEDVKDMVSDYNGDLDFRTDEAQFGYLDPSQYLILPDNGNYFSLPVPADDAARVQRAKLIALITAYNVPALGGNVDAVKYAYLRAKIISKGFLYDFQGGINGRRHVYTDEVRVATAEDTAKVTGEITGAVKDFIKSPVRAFIDNYWRVLVSICAHVLAVRSHHYKEGASAEQSYEALYNRLWRACAIDDPFPFSDLKKLYRTALHPFGLASLADVYQDGVDNRRLPRTLLIRADAMPAGAAKPGTALAIINLMRAAAWYSQWEEAFQKEIKAITLAVESVKVSRYSYHVARTLYGKAAPDDEEVQAFVLAETAARALAPYLVGYVTVECEGSPIQSQMTLRQASDDQIGLKNRFMRFLTGVGAKVESNLDINAMLPPAPRKEEKQVPDVD